MKVILLPGSSYNVKPGTISEIKEQIIEEQINNELIPEDELREMMSTRYAILNGKDIKPNDESSTLLSGEEELILLRYISA